jgi:hypothetical protein
MARLSSFQRVKIPQPLRPRQRAVMLHLFVQLFLESAPVEIIGQPA